MADAIRSAPLETEDWDEAQYLALRRLRDLILQPLVVPLAKLRVAPTLVSLIGVVLAMSTLWTLGRWPGWALVAFLGALCADALDGALARRRARGGVRGKLVDLVCDSATQTLLLVATLEAGLGSPVRVALAVYASMLLLLLAVLFHTAQFGAGTMIRLRGGFWAHFPKSVFYLALLVYLLGGPNWVDGSILLANLFAVTIAGVFLWRLLQRPRVDLAAVASCVDSTQETSPEPRSTFED